MSRYIDGSTIAECRDLRRQGHSLASLAGRLGIDPEALATLLGEPCWKTIPTEPAADGCDLWRADDLQAQL